MGALWDSGTRVLNFENVISAAAAQAVHGLCGDKAYSVVFGRKQATKAAN